MDLSTRAREAAAAACIAFGVSIAAAAMLTPKNFFGGGQDACAEPDIAPLSPAPIVRMSSVHAELEGEIMQQLRIIISAGSAAKGHGPLLSCRSIWTSGCAN